MKRLGIIGEPKLWENTTMKRQTYIPKVKERAIRVLTEIINEHPSICSAIQAIASKTAARLKCCIHDTRNM